MRLFQQKKLHSPDEPPLDIFEENEPTDNDMSDIPDSDEGDRDWMQSSNLKLNPPKELNDATFYNQMMKVQK